MEHIHLEGGNYYHIFNRGNNHCNLFEKPSEFEHFLWLYDKYVSPVADTLAWVLMPNHFHLLVYIKKDVVYKYSIETLNRISPDKIWFEEHKWETVGLSEFSENLFDADRACPDWSGSRDAVRSEERTTVDADLSACVAPDNVKMKEDNIKKLENNVKTKIGNLKTPVPYRHFSHLFNAYSRYLQVRTGRTGNLFERPFKRKLVDGAGYLKRVVVYIHDNPVHHRYCDHSLEYPWSSYIDSMSENQTKLKRDAILKLFGNKENFEYQHKQKIDIAEIEKWLEIDPLELHDFDLSKHDADRACPDWSVSIDTVKAGEADLSAFAEPDNVELMEDNVKLEMDDNVANNEKKSLY